MYVKKGVMRRPVPSVPQPMNAPVRGDLKARARCAARISSRHLYVLRDLVDYLPRQRIVLPRYTYLQDVVRRALAFERDRLSDALSEAMTPTDIELLDHLLSVDEGLHTVTGLKHQPRDFSHQQLLTEIRRGERIRPLFAVAQRIVVQAQLSVESVRFYASLVDYLHRLQAQTHDAGGEPVVSAVFCPRPVSTIKRSSLECLLLPGSALHRRARQIDEGGSLSAPAPGVGRPGSRDEDPAAIPGSNRRG
jgi:hypothetical protein